MTETIGARIRRMRNAKGLSLRACASEAGFSNTYLYLVETDVGTAIPTEETLRKLADILDDDFDDLMRLAGRIPDDIAEFVLSDNEMLDALRRVKQRRISGKRLRRMVESQKGKK